jgi:ATP/maltotriose-dependent transcriptional regulator MalT
VVVEMEEVVRLARESGERRMEGRALTALAEAVLQHRADAARAHELVRQALHALEGEPPQIRFEPLRAAYEVAAWLGDAEAFEEYATAALAAARAADRKDLETLVIHALVTAYVLKLEFGQARPLVQRALELAEASGSHFSRAQALMSKGWTELVGEQFAEAEADFTEARELFVEIGIAPREAHATMMVGRAVFAQGDYSRAEKELRTAVRGLKGADDRGSLCEAQRALAMVLAEKGELDEAERLALEARETVGPEDRVSVATTALGLGVVRAAQGRAEEAEQLMREAIDGFHSYDMRALEHWALRYLSEFLRAQGRLDEADAYASRRAELAPASTAPIV